MADSGHGEREERRGRVVVWRDGWLLGLDDYEPEEPLDVRVMDAGARESGPPVSCIRDSIPDGFVTG